ncbi:hypothetical protein HK097_008939 [Rhizophlyctis rosea]|uniref:Uncharacterized protein n=1 Tax=Rhizophlyctis rosea TaxID=64517 RepID=A0AAD5S9R9_9FUNG|nr:hypothetical protein HK097_008939 [Rhizophlyctis rosea]
MKYFCASDKELTTLVPALRWTFYREFQDAGCSTPLHEDDTQLFVGDGKCHAATFVGDGAGADVSYLVLGGVMNMYNGLKCEETPVEAARKIKNECYVTRNSSVSNTYAKIWGSTGETTGTGNSGMTGTGSDSSANRAILVSAVLLPTVAALLLSFVA